MEWVWLGGGVLGLVLLAAVGARLVQAHIMRVYFPHLVRIFQEKPLFITPFASPIAGAESVSFMSTHGVTLCGCYWRAERPRKGVIVFGLEFGSNRWACVPYCRHLHEQGFDVFSFEFRGQGESPAHDGYQPMQWVTDHEVDDFRSALAYLKGRPDADPRGVGFFGISKGAGAGVLAAAEDPYVRCCATDGLFATHTTMVPYMKRWVLIYGKHSRLIRALPHWYFRWMAHVGLRHVEKDRRCIFPHVEQAVARLAPRPLLMVHGGADNYIKPDMARALFEQAGEPKEFWLIDGAKHNRSLDVAGAGYERRLAAFFTAHLAADAESVAPATYARQPGALSVDT
jgi:alpha-beta hydrolase superfamily lysophospholipase